MTIIAWSFVTGLVEPELPKDMGALVFGAHIPQIGALISVPFCGKSVPLEVQKHCYTVPNDYASHGRYAMLKLEVHLGIPSGVSFAAWDEAIRKLKEGS